MMINSLMKAFQELRRLIFETDSLANASPSTISRCSTVLLLEEAVGFSRRAACWLQKMQGHWLPLDAQEETRFWSRNGGERCCLHPVCC